MPFFLYLLHTTNPLCDFVLSPAVFASQKMYFLYSYDTTLHTNLSTNAFWSLSRQPFGPLSVQYQKHMKCSSN